MSPGESAATPAGAALRLRAAVEDAAGALARAGVATPRADAEQLAGHLLGLDGGALAGALLLGRELAEPQLAAYRELVAQRAERIPLQHLTGQAPFRYLLLRVGPGVFVPRPETEVVAGLAVAAARAASDAPAPDPGRGAGPGPVTVVDLCTGSGAIALAVATEVPAARVVAVERERSAHAWAAQNVERLAPGRVDLRLAEVTADAAADGGPLADLRGLVDVVVANPPYIPPGAVPVDPEVADHDPAPALYGGGPDGLDVVRAVVELAAQLLRPGGQLVVEHGDPQGRATRELAERRGWEQVRTEPDLTGRDRALVARWPGAPGEHAPGTDARRPTASAQEPMTDSPS